MKVSVWHGSLFVLCVAGLLSSEGAQAQRNADARVALKKLVDATGQLSPNVRKHLSSGMQNYLRYAAAVVSGTSPQEIRGQFSMPQISPRQTSSGPGGTIQVSSPAMDFAKEGFTQSTTSSAWCGNSVVVGYEDTGAFFRTDPSGQSGVPISLDGVSFSTDTGAKFTDIGFLTPGTSSANALLGDPVVTCSSPKHFQYASILNVPTPDGLDSILGPSVSLSTDGGRSWSSPVQAVSVDASMELIDKPWMAVDPADPQRMYLTYTHIFFLGCINIELVSSVDGGRKWSGPTIVVSDCDNFGLEMLTGSNVVVSPGGKVYVAYEFFPAPPPGASFVNNAIYFARSLDHGTAFSKPFKVAEVIPGGDGIELNGHVVVDEYPQLAVDRTNRPSRGTVYLTWPDGRDKIVRDANAPSGTYAYPDIFAAKSTSFGESFKILGPISRTPKDFSGVGRDQFLPGIAVDKDGEVAVCYYDRRNDRANLRIDRYCSVSGNEGKSWKDLRASDLNWMPTPDLDPLDPRPGAAIGKYDALTSEFLLHSDGFFGAFEIEIGGNPNIVAKKF
jgi:hypothetical protein